MRNGGGGIVEIRETKEQIETASEHNNKRAAVLIIVLAAGLAIIEMAGSEAQFTSMKDDIDASDLYNFYQAKTIRSTILSTAVESTGAVDAAASAPAPGSATPLLKQVAAWKKEMDRLNSEPETGQGREQLLARARVVEAERDKEMSAFRQYEMSAALMQLAIVAASASVITAIVWLEVAGVVFGFAGIVLGVLGWLAPSLLSS
jgi:hypothetical protein